MCYSSKTFYEHYLFSTTTQLTLRTLIKRLVRKTICFSKSTQMHDIVLGLFVNRYAFGRAV